MSDDPVVLAGQGRILGGSPTPSPCRITLEAERLEVDVTGAPPILAAYRDLTTLATQPGSTLLVFGDGTDAVRIVVEQLGDQVGRLIGELRERRTRQRLTDALVEAEPDPFELVEYASGADHAVAQVGFQPWGAELVPLDERLAWRRIRRGSIASAVAETATGGVRIDWLPGAGGSTGEPLTLLALGDAATRWANRFAALRDAAVRDASTLVTGLLPDAPFGTRQRLSRLLVDGRPASLADLGPDAPLLDAAVLSEPVFAASFRALLEKAGPAAPRWFAMAPEAPGADTRKAWNLVALPGNLVALELVSEGAHATYLFRVVPRASFDGAGPDAQAEAAAAAATGISEALIDARFLREPMALPAAQLADASHVRYRLALAALPSLAAARRRFVARLVHDDPARWAAALDSLVAWHGACRDDAAEWPGRTEEERRVTDAAGGAGPGNHDGLGARDPGGEGTPESTTSTDGANAGSGVSGG